MDTRFLESLICVAEHGSIAAAARAQGLTPAAISQRIKTLEQDLGASLFVRTGKTVQATAACSRLLPHARQLIAEAASLRHHLDEGTPTGTLKIGAIATVMANLMPQVLMALRESAPKVTPELHPGTSPTLLERVESGALDIAILIAPPFDLAKSLNVQILWSEPLNFLCRTDCDLGVEEALSTLPYIRYDPASWGGRQAERYLNAHGLSPRTFCTLDDLETTARMVDAGLGVTLLPRWYQGFDLKLNLKWTPIEDQTFTRDIVAVHKSTPPNPRAIAAFKDALIFPLPHHDAQPR